MCDPSGVMPSVKMLMGRAFMMEVRMLMCKVVVGISVREKFVERRFVREAIVRSGVERVGGRGLSTILQRSRNYP